jgi:thiamine kinase-like enzyme
MNDLMAALSRKAGKLVVNAEHQEKSLQGGTLGDVRLVSGIAETESGEKLPFDVVHKKQKKWERSGDPLSWRREYDLYHAGFDHFVSGDLHMPACYRAKMNGDATEMELWMAYIGGVSGAALTADMLEKAAYLWGRFQGEHASDEDALRRMNCLNDAGYLQREFEGWHTQRFSHDYLISKDCRMPEHLKQRLKSGEVKLIDGKSFEYACLRSDCFGVPTHIKEMLANIDEHRCELFAELQQFPTVLCHGDFWNENIFCAEGQITLIDWDTAHWGFPGEDLACLLVDGMPVERFDENIRRLIPAYLSGLSESGYTALPTAKRILAMSLIKFGYRMLQEHIFANEPWGLQALEKLYEIGGESIETLE